MTRTVNGTGQSRISPGRSRRALRPRTAVRSLGRTSQAVTASFLAREIRMNSGGRNAGKNQHQALVVLAGWVAKRRGGLLRATGVARLRSGVRGSRTLVRVFS